MRDLGNLRLADRLAVFAPGEKVMRDLEIIPVDGDVDRGQAAGVFPVDVGAGEKGLFDRPHVASVDGQEQVPGFRGHLGGGCGPPGNGRGEAKGEDQNAKKIIASEKSKKATHDPKNPH